ncbi:MAG: acyl-CoA/acyl-ACP dehydrogenase [Proteobacteria bacterium]|nr:acyl-CoA/acyl-ACP dehydrogenase [Pseudomonadota bacterium]
MADIQFTEEHEQLRAVVRKFLEDRSPEAAVRAQMVSERGYDPEVWKQLAQELGLVGLAIPEQYGGAGYGFVELAVALEEMGRALLCAPFFSSALLATHAILLGGDDAAREELLPAIAAGESLAAVALFEPGGDWDLDSIALEARSSDGGSRLSGRKTYVIDGHGADVLLVAARTESGLGLLRVAGDAPGLKSEPLPTLDLTRKLALLEFEDTPAVPLGDAGDATPLLRRVLDLAAAGLAAEQAGGAQRCLEMASEYAKERVQFGRPIGSFQAIKHRCADMLMQVEAAKSAAYSAAFSAASGEDDLRATAAMAQAYASDAYFRAAADCIQIHGGVGFTWEHPAHLYFKRAKSSALLFGDAAYHRDRLATELGL